MKLIKEYWAWIKEEHLERIEVVNDIAMILSIISIVLGIVKLLS